MKSSATLRQDIDLLQALPALPKIASEILSIKLASDKDDALLLKLIEKDPAISAKIIGLANSPLFGTSRKILTTGDAEAVLGIKRVKMVALSFAMMSSVTRKQRGALDVMHLWQHSMAVALAMDALAKAMPADKRPPDDEIYLAGLLHDMGFLVLEYIAPEISNDFHNRIAASGGLSAELEAETLEINHSELGALLAEHWNLTPAIIAVMRHHHAHAVAADVVGQPLITMCSLAERLIPTFGANDAQADEIDINEWLTLGISAERVEEVGNAMRKRAADSSGSQA